MNLLTLLHARLAPDAVPPFFSCAFEKAVAASSRHHMAHAKHFGMSHDSTPVSSIISEYQVPVSATGTVPGI